MAMQISYTEARARFASVCDRVRDNRETVIITRRGKAEIAMVAVDELSSLLETAYLLRSPKNANRLLAALRRALARTEEPRTIEELRRELGLAAEE